MTSITEKVENLNEVSARTYVDSYMDVYQDAVEKLQGRTPSNDEAFLAALMSVSRKDGYLN